MPLGSDFRRSFEQPRRGGQALGGEAELNVGEDVGERAVVGLGPAVERVLVALGAFDPDAQERRGRALGQRLDRDVLTADEPPPEQVEPRLGRRSRSCAPFLRASIRAASRPAQAVGVVAVSAGRA